MVAGLLYTCPLCSFCSTVQYARCNQWNKTGRARKDPHRRIHTQGVESTPVYVRAYGYCRMGEIRHFVARSSLTLSELIDQTIVKSFVLGMILRPQHITAIFDMGGILPSIYTKNFSSFLISKQLIRVCFVNV